MIALAHVLLMDTLMFCACRNGYKKFKNNEGHHFLLMILYIVMMSKLKRHFETRAHAGQKDMGY